MKKFIVIILLFAAPSLVFAQKKKKTVIPPRRINVIVSTDVNTTNVTVPPKVSFDLEKRIKAFELVWKTIRDNYFDQTFGGLDWNKIRKEYEPQVLKTTTDLQLHLLLHDMIKRLNKSHFAIIPPDVYLEIERAKTLARLNQKSSADGSGIGDANALGEDKVTFEPTEFARFGIGVDLRMINNQFVITQVEKGSTAEAAGLKPGFVIEKVDDTELKGLYAKYQKLDDAAGTIKKMLPLEIVSLFLNGLPDTSVSIVYLDEKDQVKEISVKRERLNGQVVSLGQNMPGEFFVFATKSLNSDTGYIKFNLFGLQTIEFLCSALTELKDKKTLIIDLRGNVGGLFGALVGVGGMLTDKNLDLGTQFYNRGSDSFTATPKAKSFKGKLVFLTDGQSVSSAEILAAVMQEGKRAIIVGERTAGAALSAISIVLPTGAVLFYPFANFKTPKGNLVEGIGVIPNFPVALDRKSLLEGRDVQLETALKVIDENKKAPKQEEKALIITGTLAGDDEPKLAPPPRRLNVIPRNTNEIIVKDETVVKDEKALKVIADFITAIGGEEELKKIESYQLWGYAELSVKGSAMTFDISIFRQKPSKYLMIWKSPNLGETRELYTDKGYFTESDFGIDTESPVPFDTSRTEIFAPINSLLRKDALSSVKYQGEFDREGRKTHVVEAKIAFETVALAFDVETKMLIGFSAPGDTYFLDDYRKVGNVKLPFSIVKDYMSKYLIMDIKLNEKIDESVFNKKENCFDRPN